MSSLYTTLLVVLAICGVHARAPPSRQRVTVAPPHTPVPEGLTGTVVTPGQPAYLGDTMDWNSAITPSSPRVIVFAGSVVDVVNAVQYAVQNNLTIAIRSGRHSYLGFSVNNGIVIDVSYLKTMTFNTTAKQVTLGPGVRLAELYDASSQHNLTFPGDRDIRPHDDCPRTGNDYGIMSTCLISLVFYLPPALMLIAFSSYYYMVIKPWQSKDRDTKLVLRSRIFGVCQAVATTAAPVFVIIVNATIMIRDDRSKLLVADTFFRVSAWVLALPVYMISWSRNTLLPKFLLGFYIYTALASVIDTANAITETANKVLTGGQLVAVMIHMCCAVYLAVSGYYEARIAPKMQETEPDDPDNRWPPLNQLVKLFKPDRILIGLGIFFCVSQGVATLYSLDKFAGLMSGQAALDGPSELRKQTILFFAYTLGLAVFAWGQQAVFGIAGERATKRVRQLLFENLLEQDGAYLDMKENNKGTLIARLTSDCDAFATVLTTQFSMVVTPIVQAVSGFMFLYPVSWKLTTLTLTMSVFNVIFVAIRSHHISTQFSGWYSDRRAQAIGKGTETINGIMCVREHVEEEKEKRAFTILLNAQYVIGVLKSKVEGFFQGVEVFLSLGIVGFVIWFGSIMIIENEFEAKQLASYALVAMSASQSMAVAVMIIPTIAQAAGPATRVLALINRRPEKNGYMDLNKGDRPETMKGEITLDAVSFRYPHTETETPDLQASFKVPAGTSLALVGKSGAGKSTAMKLMMRQYDINPATGDEGRVLMDGRDLRELAPRWLMEHIGVVSQFPVLFDDSVYYNITYGIKGEAKYHWGGRDRVVPEDVFWKVVKEANAHDFVTNMVLDDTAFVGEGGEKLSGGQRQRVTIARVLLKNPSVLFLDEATSALDPESEFQVVQALRNASRGRTCVMIAHRLNTISHCDNIIVLVGGKKVEEGGHDVLIQKEDGYYASMYKRQMETQWS